MGEAGNSGAYVSDVSYHPNGLWSVITRANMTTDTQTVAGDGMRRPVQISTSVQSGTGFDTGVYAYDGAGNVTAMGSDSFTYDAFSRLDTAAVHGYAQAFTFDEYGNIEQVDTTPPGGSLESTLFPVDPGTNHLTDASYDGAGNLTSRSGTAFAYDAFNMLQHRNYAPDASEWSAIYTADDERLAVWQLDKNGDYEQLWRLRGLDNLLLRQVRYGLPPGGGDLIFQDGFESGDTSAWSTTSSGPSGAAPSSGSTPEGTPSWTFSFDYIHRDGQVLAYAGELDVWHQHLDHLGTVRQVTDDAGEAIEDHDYLPFGEEVTSAHFRPLQFTGHERDRHGAEPEDDLDYMHARHYSAGLVRFLSVDPAALQVSTNQPLRWNRYIYGINSPLKYVDPDGKSPVLIAVGLAVTMALLAPDVANTPTTAHDVVPSDRTGERFALGAAEGVLGPLASRASGLLRGAVGRLLGGRISSVATGLQSKAAARTALEGIGLSSKQSIAARSAISRATGSDAISILQKGDSVIIQTSRPGRNGQQVFQTVVMPDGSKQVTQFGIDASGKVVHIDTKFGELQELFKGPE